MPPPSSPAMGQGTRLCIDSQLYEPWLRTALLFRCSRACTAPVHHSQGKRDEPGGESLRGTVTVSSTHARGGGAAVGASVLSRARTLTLMVF